MPPWDWEYNSWNDLGPKYAQARYAASKFGTSSEERKYKAETLVEKFHQEMARRKEEEKLDGPLLLIVPRVSLQVDLRNIIVAAMSHDRKWARFQRVPARVIEYYTVSRKRANRANWCRTLGMDMNLADELCDLVDTVVIRVTNTLSRTSNG